MKPAKFDYYRAHTLDHACSLLTAHGEDAKLLAGGQSLIAAMNYRLARPQVLIDVSNVEHANQISEESRGVRIAATTTQRFAEKHLLVRDRLPVLAEAIEHIAHFQIRNKGTVGGSIANADPASELPAMALLLDAELEIATGSARTQISAGDFFITYMTTALQPDQVLCSILFQTPPPTSGWGFHEVARRAGDFALVGSAAVIGLDAAGKCQHARAVLFGVAATPVRLQAVESALVGQSFSSELLNDVSTQVRDHIDPESDVHVTAEYRRRVAEVLTVRALQDAFHRAGGTH